MRDTICFLTLLTDYYNLLAEFIDRLPKNMLLLVIAVTIHNLPEGFVVGK